MEQGSSRVTLYVNVHRRANRRDEPLTWRRGGDVPGSVAVATGGSRGKRVIPFGIRRDGRGWCGRRGCWPLEVVLVLVAGASSSTFFVFVVVVCRKFS